MRRAIRRGRFGGQGGFTLFEIIMVLLLLGVISYFAATRLFSDDSISQVAEIDLLKNHLRYAQSRAMNTELDWGIFFESSTNKYFLFRGDAPGVPVRLPGDESVDSKIAMRSITYRRVHSAPVADTVLFRGADYGTPGAVTLTVQMWTGGDITITKNTGFIP